MDTERTQLGTEALVKALREKYDKTDPLYFFNRLLFREAADTIEALLSEVERLEYDKKLLSECVSGQSAEYTRNQETIYNLTADNARLARERDDLRNELCLKCGKYHDAHNGACDGCRWRKE